MHPRQPPFFDLDDLVAQLRNLGNATAAEALCEYDLALRVTLARLDEARLEQARIREAYGAARWTCRNYVHAPDLTATDEVE